VITALVGGAALLLLAAGALKVADPTRTVGALAARGWSVRPLLVRAGALKRIGKQELTELIQDAWLSRASTRRAERWLAERDI